MRVAVVGLGRMGEALAQRLLDQGVEVVVWNRSPGKAQALVTAGAEEASDVAGACRGAEIVLSCLANDEAVRHVALGPEGIRRHGGAAAYIDCSTISPALSGELAAAIESFAAAPVLGGPQAVREGQATYLVGAPDDVVERITPLLEALSPNIRRYRAAPLASAAKVTANSILVAGVVALAEGFAVGRAGGLSDQDLRRLLIESPLVAPGVRNRFDAVLEGSGDGWWSVALGAKDAGLALEMARDAGRDVPVLESVRARFLAAASAGLEDRDISAVGSLYLP